MSKLSNLLKHLPPALQKHALSFLYLRNGKKLQDVKSFYGGQFYAYKIEGVYIPYDSLTWFVDYNYYQNCVNSVSAFAYKPHAGDVIVDIGAGMGEETIVYSNMTGATGKVYSIEANPEVFEVLKEIVKLNNLGNVQLYNLAINSINSPVEIIIDQNSFLGGSIGQVHKNSKSFLVEGLRFDRFLENNKIEKIDLLKVNIEGAERFVIETIGESITAIRNLAISCHDFRYKEAGNEFFRTKKIIMDYLSKQGYAISVQNTGVDYIDDWVYASKKV